MRRSRACARLARSTGLAVAVAVLCFVAVAVPSGAAQAYQPPEPGSGYWMLNGSGTVFAFGTADYCGAPTDLAGVAVAIVPTPDGLGYWILVTSGVVDFFPCPDMPAIDRASYEGANLFGSELRPGENAIAMSALRDGSGYWVFTTLGRALPFGNAKWYGDMGGVTLNGSVVGSVATPSGHGYYMVASDGGIFTFGDARFHGSLGAAHLNQPVMAMAPTPDGKGYWLVASDGGIFAFGARFYGSMGGTRLNRAVVGMVPSPTGRGYLMVAQDGGIFAFGDVPFHGSLGGTPMYPPMTAVAVMPRVVVTTITYKVTGSGTAQVTYADSGQARVTKSVHLPWSYTVPWPPPDSPSLVASFGGSGSFSCTIDTNGVQTFHLQISGLSGAGQATLYCVP